MAGTRGDFHHGPAGKLDGGQPGIASLLLSRALAALENRRVLPWSARSLVGAGRLSHPTLDLSGGRTGFGGWTLARFCHLVFLCRVEAGAERPLVVVSAGHFLRDARRHSQTPALHGRGSRSGNGAPDRTPPEPGEMDPASPTGC